MKGATDDDRLECKPCGKVFTKKKQYNIHMKSMQHLYVLQAIADKEQEKQEEAKQTAFDKARKDLLTRRCAPIVDRFHVRMYKVMEQALPSRTEAPSNDLSESILNHYTFSRPRAPISKRRRCLYRLIHEIVAELYPKAKLEVYGSIPLLLDSENSDIDVSIIIGESDAVEVLSNIGDGIGYCNSPHLTVKKILTARIPVITISDALSGLQLDLSLWMLDKLEINRVFTAYLKMDPRIRPLIKAVRVWAKSRNINDCYTGTVNSFAWTVTCIAYLLMEGIVPPIPDKIDDLENSTFQTSNTKTVGELFLGYFEWLLQFEYQTKRISLRCGGITEKEAEKFSDDTVFVVERPRTPYQNMTRQVSQGSVKKLRYEWHRVVEMLRTGALLNDLCTKTEVEHIKRK
jgi:DNA polymerase sigma